MEDMLETPVAEDSKQSWIWILLAFILVAGAFWYFTKSSPTPPVTSASPSISSFSSPPQSATDSTGSALLDPNLISISKNTYVPDSLTVKVGDTVTWINEESYGHDVVSDDQVFKSPKLATGEKYSYTFTKAGTYTYYCSIHPFMKSSIIVTP